jgi:hypothetical protein
LSAKFIACVAFSVNATHSGPGAPNISAAAQRQSYTSFAAAMESLCPLRPGLAALCFMKALIALVTD